MRSCLKLIFALKLYVYEWNYISDIFCNFLNLLPLPRLSCVRTYLVIWHRTASIRCWPAGRTFYSCYHLMKEFQPRREWHKPERARSVSFETHPPMTALLHNTYRFKWYWDVAPRHEQKIPYTFLQQVERPICPSSQGARLEITLQVRNSADPSSLATLLIR
jgi:hypothetical protein